MGRIIVTFLNCLYHLTFSVFGQSNQTKTTWFCKAVKKIFGDVKTLLEPLEKVVIQLEHGYRLNQVTQELFPFEAEFQEYGQGHKKWMKKLIKTGLILQEQAIQGYDYDFGSEDSSKRNMNLVQANLQCLMKVKMTQWK